MGFLFLFLFITGIYLRPGEVFPQLAPLRIMLTLGVAGITVACFEALFRSKNIFRNPKVLLLLAMVAAVAVSRLAQGWAGGAVLAIGDFGPSALVFMLTVLTVNSIGKLRALSVLMIVASLVMAVIGIAAYHTGFQGTTFIVRQSTEETEGMIAEGNEDEADEALVDAARPLRRIRSIGFLNDPNDLAQFFLVALPMFGLAWRRGQPLRNFLFVLAPGSVVLYGVYLTHSRGALFGLAAIVLILTRRRWGTFPALISAGLLGVGALALNFAGGRSISARESSAGGRIDAWGVGLALLRANPLFGVGYNLFTDYNTLTAHNSFVLCFAELGLVGYFIWLALVSITTIQTASIFSSEGDHEDGDPLDTWARILTLSMYGFLGSAWFLSRTYTLTLYILLGMMVALLDMAQSEDRPIQYFTFPNWTIRIGAAGFASIAAVYVTLRLSHL